MVRMRRNNMLFMVTIVFIYRDSIVNIFAIKLASGLHIARIMIFGIVCMALRQLIVVLVSTAEKSIESFSDKCSLSISLQRNSYFMQQKHRNEIHTSLIYK